MKYRPDNTLAHFNAAPQTHFHDLSALPVAVLAEATKKYRQAVSGQANPNDEATTFYTVNHAASIVRKSFTLNEPLPAWAQGIMQTYTDVTIEQGERLLHYLLLITTREMRHLKSCTAAFWKDVEKEFGPEAVAILKSISSHGGEDTAMSKYLEAPNMTIGTYVKTLAYAFHKAGNAGWNGSYGGQPWGHTTDALVSMLHGVTSMEMLVDTGYTLAHNGGPIFDKGLGLYSHYDAHLLTVLDIQRSGQMLDLMFETQTLGVKKTPLASAVATALKQHKPEVFKGYFDWKLVDALRPDKHKAPAKYKKVIEAQPKKAKPSKPVVVSKFGKKVQHIGQFAVYPGQSVAVYQREQ